MEMDNEMENELDLMEILRKFWDKRILIIKIAVVFMVIGLFVALFSPKQFTAERVFVPQTGKSTSASRYAGLAAMAGISLDMGGSDATISPMVYPHILKNVDFQKELMHTPIHFEGYNEPIELYDYYTDKKYHKFNLLGAIKKYTIGLPGVILTAVRGDDEDKPAKPLPEVDEESGRLNALTVKEDRIAKTLSKSISLSVDQKQGYVTLTANMSEAVAAAELCNSTYNLLKKYVSSYKTVKAQSDLEFVEAQCEQAKRDYEEKQSRYASYVDSHRGVSTASAAVEQQRLEADMQLAQQLYSELAKNAMTSRIKVKEETVSFSDLAPAKVPIQRTKPKRASILAIWTFLGICAGCGWVFAKDWWREQKGKFTSKSSKEDQRQ